MLLFALSLLALWFAFNALFMAPGSYRAFSFEVAGIGIAIGVMAAWVSSKRFARTGHETGLGAILKAPPMVLCIFILFVFCAIRVIKLIAYW